MVWVLNLLCGSTNKPAIVKKNILHSILSGVELGNVNSGLARSYDLILSDIFVWDCQGRSHIL